MTTLPPLPGENEDPWFEKRKRFDDEVRRLLEGPSSPEVIQDFFNATLRLTMYTEVGDILIGAGAGAVDQLSRGSHGQILQASDTAPLGVVWSDGLTRAQEAVQDAINLATATAIEAVRYVTTEYAVSDSEITAPTTGWTTEQPTRTPGSFLWSRTVTVKGPDDNLVEITSAPALLTGNTGTPGVPGSTGPAGPEGPAGRGLTSSAISYQTNNNGTTAPTGTWSPNPTPTVPGQFMWTRTVLTWSDGTTSAAYSVAGHGTAGRDGADGIDGNDGIDGKGIASSTISYQVGNTSTVAPTGTWTSTPGETSPGQFLWTRTVFTYTDNTTSTAYSISAHGTQGPQGPTGSTGPAGRGVSSTSVSYQGSTSGTAVPGGTWVAAPPAVSPGQFLWSRTIITYTDNSTSTAYSVALQGPQGPQGSTGPQGPNGEAGVGISGAAVSYQASSSGTTTPTGTWLASPPSVSAGQFLWTRTITTYTNNSTSTSYSVARSGTNGSTGSTGPAGPEGISVTSVTPYFLQIGSGSATPAKPTTNPPGGSWSLTEPGYTTSTELYRTELVTYSNGAFMYTNVSKVSSYAAATQAITVANLADAAAKGLIKASATDPGHAPGRLWMVLNGSGDTIGIKISNGSAWSSYTLMADQILVPGSVGGTQISNGAITTEKLNSTAINGMTITGATVRTSSSGQRVQLDTTGLRAFNSSNAETARLAASSGGLTLTGKLRSGAGNQRAELESTGIAFYDSNNAKGGTLTAYNDSPGNSASAGVVMQAGGRNVYFGRWDLPSGGTADMFANSAWLEDIYSTYVNIGSASGSLMEGAPIGRGHRLFTPIEFGANGQLDPDEWSNGRLLFTGGSDMVVDNIFDLRFHRYKIFGTVKMSQVASLLFRFRTPAGANLSAARYNYVRDYGNGSAYGLVSNDQTRFEIAGSSGTEHDFEITVVNARGTSGLSKLHGITNSVYPTANAGSVPAHYAGHYAVATDIAGFQLSATVGTVSGEVSVYGIV